MARKKGGSLTDRFSLKDKVIFVCGGLGLIGAEVTKAIASAGALTVILDVRSEEGKSLSQEIIKSGKSAAFEKFDITQMESIETNLKNYVKEYHRLDGWVNLAYPRTDDWRNKVEDVTLGSLRKNIDMQLNAAIWSSRAVALIMKDCKIPGSIVNLGSTYGVLGNDFTIYEGTKMTSPMAYSAIKGGIINFSRYMASYFGPYGIRVNTLCPGGIEAEGQDPVFQKNYVRKTPLKRMGIPEDIAGAAVFLLSDASAYVTGTTFMVDGGWTIV